MRIPEKVLAPMRHSLSVNLGCVQSLSVYLHLYFKMDIHPVMKVQNAHQNSGVRSHSSTGVIPFGTQ